MEGNNTDWQIRGGDGDSGHKKRGWRRWPREEPFMAPVNEEEGDD